MTKYMTGDKILNDHFADKVPVKPSSKNDFRWSMF